MNFLCFISLEFFFNWRSSCGYNLIVRLFLYSQAKCLLKKRLEETWLLSYLFHWRFNLLLVVKSCVYLNFWINLWCFAMAASFFNRDFSIIIYSLGEGVYMVFRKHWKGLVSACCRQLYFNRGNLGFDLQAFTLFINQARRMPLEQVWLWPIHLCVYFRCHVGLCQSVQCWLIGFCRQTLRPPGFLTSGKATADFVGIHTTHKATLSLAL